MAGLITVRHPIATKIEFLLGGPYNMEPSPSQQLSIKDSVTEIQRYLVCIDRIYTQIAAQEPRLSPPIQVLKENVTHLMQETNKLSYAIRCPIVRRRNFNRTQIQQTLSSQSVDGRTVFCIYAAELSTPYNHVVMIVFWNQTKNIGHITSKVIAEGYTKQVCKIHTTSCAVDLWSNLEMYLQRYTTGSKPMVEFISEKVFKIQTSGDGIKLYNDIYDVVVALDNGLAAK